MKSNHFRNWYSLIWECFNDETAMCTLTVASFWSLLCRKPSSLSLLSFFTFNLIFGADIVNLKFSNVLDSESEESWVHFWKWLYADKSLCRSLKQGICWWIRVVLLFPCHLQEWSSKCATRIFESYCKRFTGSHIPQWVFLMIGNKKLNLKTKSFSALVGDEPKH